METNNQNGDKCYKRTHNAMRKYKRPKLNFGGKLIECAHTHSVCVQLGGVREVFLEK